MSGLLSSYLIDPVIRQARRFSSPAPNRDSSARETSPERESHVRNDAQSLAHDSPLPAFLAELLHNNDVNSANSPSDVARASTTSTSSRGRPGFVEAEGRDQSNVGAIVESPRSRSPDPESLQDERLSSISYETPGNLQSVSTENPMHLVRDHVSMEDSSNRSRRSTGRGTQDSLGSLEEMEGSRATANISDSLPADDGMQSLRQKIHRIREMDGTIEEKARWMLMLMTKDYIASRAHLIRSVSPSSIITHDIPGTPTTPNSESVDEMGARSAKSPPPHAATSETDQDYNLGPEDMAPTYYPQPERIEDADEEDMEEEPVLGCEHYKRNVKIQCSDCNRWYTCRFCHDAVESHPLNRPKTRHMLCMLCRTPQPAAGQCQNCGEFAAWYYCDICKFWDNDSTKRIYHCPDCGICRKGEGLGKDFQHCKRCNVCISIRFASDHRCIEGATECDCPICGDYMFSSARSVVAMPCGHYMHSACHTKYMQTAYRCPICSRSAVNMELQWRKLDRAIEAQPMPSQFERTRVQLQCNDCSAKSVGRYHWLGNKCGVCESYNTNELRVIEPGDEQDEARSPITDVAPAREPAIQPVEGVQEMQDLTLASPATAAPQATGSSPPVARSPPREAEYVERVDSANPSPRQPLQLRELRPSRPYFLNMGDAVHGDTGTQSSGFISAEAARSFSPYEMLQRVSRSLSPIRYYLDGLGDDGLGEADPADELEIEDEDEDNDDEDDEDEGDNAVDEDDESDVSMGDENDELDEDDDEEDDDEALDIPGHR